MAGSTRCAMWLCPSRARTRASGIAAAARWVASCCAGGLSAPASRRVGALTVSNWPGWYAQSTSDLTSLGSTGTTARRAGQAGLDRTKGDLVLGQLDDAAQRGEERTLQITGRDGVVDRLDGFEGAVGAGEAKTRFVEDEAGHVVGEACGTHGAVRPVGVSPHRDGLPSAGRDHVDDGSYVFELALDAVVRAVAAGAATAAVNGEGGDRAAQLVDERPVGGVVVERAVNHDERRPVAVGPHPRSRCRRLIEP
jgi:hypothetical protein